MGVFTATRYVASLPQVSIDWLVGEGVSLVLLDRDNTCVPRDTRRVPAEVTAWLAGARSAGLPALLLDRAGVAGDGYETIRTLQEILPRLAP